jgi:hypothetical protein
MAAKSPVRYDRVRANSTLKKGGTAGLSSSAEVNFRKDTAGQASNGTQELENRLFQQAATALVCTICFLVVMLAGLRVEAQSVSAVRTEPRRASANMEDQQGMPEQGTAKPIKSEPLEYEPGNNWDTGSNCDSCGCSFTSGCDIDCESICNSVYTPLCDRLWFRGEYLAWWIKSAQVPPLVTTVTNRDTSILFGGGVNQETSPGGRFTVGWLNPCQDAGLEATYLFLGNKTTSYNNASQGDPILQRPFLNALTGQQDVGIIAASEVQTGSINIQLDNEFASLEFLLRRSVYQQCNRQVDFLIGYRYGRFAENLAIDEFDRYTNRPPFVADTTALISDRFSAKNEFHGAELGLAWKTSRCRWSMELLGKLALGSTRSRVIVNGSTVITVPEENSVTYPGGFLALPTNMGAFDQDSFSVMPELGINVGYDITCHLKATFGYTFLYWSRIARPGDQIDTNLNPTQFPPPEPLEGMPSPQFRFISSDFWTQGLNFGLEYRF